MTGYRSLALFQEEMTLSANIVSTRRRRSQSRKAAGSRRKTKSSLRSSEKMEQSIGTR